MLQKSEGAKRGLERHLSQRLAEEAPLKELISEAQKMAAKAQIPEHEVVIVVSIGGVGGCIVAQFRSY